MPKTYGTGGRPGERVRPERQLNPVWRGVGCLLMVAIPIASWFVGDYVRQLHFQNQAAWGVPYLYDVPPYTYNAVVTIVITLLMYAFLTVLYGWIRRPKFGTDLDVRERPRRKPRRSR
ncbi:MAG: hypothetical protein ACE5FI_04905 [Anaerolineales bacterium]